MVQSINVDRVCLDAVFFYLLDCHIVTRVFFVCVCRSDALRPVRILGICSNCAIACFHILFIPSAYACGYPRYLFGLRFA